MKTIMIMRINEKRLFRNILVFVVKLCATLLKSPDFGHTG